MLLEQNNSTSLHFNYYMMTFPALLSCGLWEVESQAEDYMKCLT